MNTLKAVGLLLVVSGSVLAFRNEPQDPQLDLKVSKDEGKLVLTIKRELGDGPDMALALVVFKALPSGKALRVHRQQLAEGAEVTNTLRIADYAGQAAATDRYLKIEAYSGLQKTGVFEALGSSRLVELR